MFVLSFLDAETRLSIAVTDPKYTVNIISAQILDMNENVLKVLPLNSIGKDFYTTTPFVAPSQRFKIAVSILCLICDPQRIFVQNQEELKSLL